jgi:uncharacterized protein with HEPN domain
MDNVKNDFYYVKRLLRSIEITSRYLKDKSMDDLINDGFLCDAIENRFTKIAEDASNLSKDFKNKLSSIPWDGIASIRNRVCHDYDVVDFAILYKTIKVNFPSFRKSLLEVVTVHKMNLYQDAFELIENGSKKVEMRLNDEKRQKVTIGDLIIFTNTKTKEEIIVEVIDLKTFKSFNELYSSYEKTVIGYKKDEVANPNDMLDYYSQEQIEKYGALAIEIKLY